MPARTAVLAAAVSGAILALGVLPAAPVRAQGQVVNLKIANYFPPPSKQSRLTQEFGEELERRSGGRIKVQYFAGGSLLTGPAMFRGIESGVADIGYAHVYYTPGRMPVTEALGLPVGIPSGWVGAKVGFDFYNKYQPKEFASVKVLALHLNGPALLISTKPVATLEDMKGLSVRAPGVPGVIIQALGGTATPTPMAEVYDSITRGVNDAVWAPYETLRTFRFAEVAKHVTVSWQIGATFPFYLVMNRNSYERLPADLRTLVDVMSGEYQERFALMWNEIDLTGRAFGLEKGVRYIELSEQEAARWQKAVEPVFDDFAKAIKGHSEAEVKEWVAFVRERIKYWTAKQIEYRIPSPTGPAEMRPEAIAR